MTTDIQKILWKIKLFQGVLFDHENNNNNREKEEEENLKKKKTEGEMYVGSNDNNS